MRYCLPLLPRIFTGQSAYLNPVKTFSKSVNEFKAFVALCDLHYIGMKGKGRQKVEINQKLTRN